MEHSVSKTVEITTRRYTLWRLIRRSALFISRISTVSARFNLFMPNGISHRYQLDETISNFRVAG